MNGSYGFDPPCESDPAIAPCGCDDHSLDRLRDMVAGGMGQWEASRAIWGARM